MSRWGVFQFDYGDVKHVAPSDGEGHVLEPHKLSHDCACKPKVERLDNGSTMYTHNDPQRGGADA